MTSIKSAIQQASEHVGNVYQCATGQWGYQTYSEQHNAWWLPQQGHTYQRAQEYRAMALAERAAAILHVERGGEVGDVYVDDADLDRVRGERDRVTKMVRIALTRAGSYL